MAGYIGNKAVGINVTTGDILGDVGVGGVVTANAGVVVDNITIDGTEIDLSSGDLTLDVAGDIILDAGGSDILLKVGGTTFGSLRENSSNFRIKSEVSDKDIVFLGNDGGAEVTAMTIDMSAGGAATFNAGITTTGVSLMKCATNDNIRISQQTHASIQAVNDAVSAFVDLKLDGSTVTINGQSTGGTVIGNGLILTDGDIVFAGASHGICLGATSATAAKTLRDYEEGNFNPTAKVGTLASPYGSYTKVGRLVTLCFGGVFPSSSSGSIQGFESLPFSTSSGNVGNGGAFVRYSTFVGNQPYLHVDAGAAAIGLYRQDNGSGMTAANAAGLRLDAVAIYFTA